MNILIIEDEPLVAVSIIKVLQEIEPQATFQGPLQGVSQTRDWLASHPEPDLILADIQLSDGISFDIFSEGPIGCPIIFTTAYNEYAIRAFKVNSIDYLLKPIGRKDLQAALQKYHQLQTKYGNEGYLSQMRELLANFAAGKKYKDRFGVHQGRAITWIPQSEVMAFIKEEIVYLVQPGGRKSITDYRSLDEIEDVLNPASFYRANRQCIIQLSYIDSVRTEDTGKIQVKLKGGKYPDITVSKEKAAAFRKWLEG